MREARSDSGSVRRAWISDLCWLTDEPMARLQPLFPKSHGKPRVNDRRVLRGIVFVNRNGLHWCDAPKDYGRHCGLLLVPKRMVFWEWRQPS
jgi:transposase